jgi:hypothetical protein
MNKIKTIYNIVMKKTKKYNRWKNFKDIKRRYTKKQNYYGGAGVMPSLGNIASVGNTLNDIGNNGYGNNGYGNNGYGNNGYGNNGYGNNGYGNNGYGNNGYGNNGYQPSNNNTNDNVYHPHDSPTLNYLGDTLNDVNSKVSALNSGISTVNEKIDETKDVVQNTVANGIGKVTTGVYNVAKNVMSGLAESVDMGDVKQGSVAAGILIDAATIPIIESEKVLFNLVENAVANAGVSAVNIGTDVLTAIPGVGAVMEFPKLANDITNMVSQGVGLGSELLNITGHIVDETKKNVDESIETLKKLNLKAAAENAVNQVGQNAIQPLLSSAASAEAIMQRGGLKKLANDKEQIGGRINDSLAEFVDPIGYQTGILKGGHNKTKKAIVNGNDRKSRRVRFSM